MRKKTMYCTLDTETLGGAARPEGVYNAGGTIHDREGNIYASFNYIIAEHFRKIQDKAFYGKKNFPRYQQMINCGEASMLATEEEAVVPQIIACSGSHRELIGSVHVVPAQAALQHPVVGNEITSCSSQTEVEATCLAIVKSKTRERGVDILCALLELCKCTN